MGLTDLICKRLRIRISQWVRSGNRFESGKISPRVNLSITFLVSAYLSVSYMLFINFNKTCHKFMKTEQKRKTREKE